MQVTEGSGHNAFVEPSRCYETLLSPVELPCLEWIARRLPVWILPDHLTLVGLLACVAIGLCYSLTSVNGRSLLAIPVLLAINWFGDSQNGTLARARGCVQPRYGFYIDHIADTIGAVFVLGGLSLSGVMSRGIAAWLLISFLLLSVEVYLATHTLGRFQMSHWRLGPTEIRLVLALFSTLAYWFPVITVAKHSYQLFDLLGGMGIACGIGMFVVALVRNMTTLRQLDPLNYLSR